MRSSLRKLTEARSSSTRKRESSSAHKFIPNLTQLQEIVKELPDPEEWMDATYTYHLTVENRRRSIEFVRKQINRGDHRPYRWIYDGKVLIRNRDI